MNRNKDGCGIFCVYKCNKFSVVFIYIIFLYILSFWGVWMCYNIVWCFVRFYVLLVK